ncbi:MAG: esterase family protein [Lachnospiraceae bacterium]|nr:esterase family protein [Lachnospiraceae bacterium]
MALVHANFFSTTLGMERQVEVILPQEVNGIGLAGVEMAKKVPVLYLLHGGSDDQTIWQRRTSIERYACEKGLAVVMASTDLGFYSDQKYGYDYFQFFSKELPELICEFFPLISDKREDTFVAGLSMGGFGALKLGINCPERFSYAASLSGMVDPVWEYENRSDAYHLNNWGVIVELKESVNDLPYMLEKQLKAGAELPRFFMCCGTEDFLYKPNVLFKERFADRIDLLYYEEPGTHEWGFWDRNIQKVIDWLPLDKSKTMHV